MATRAEQVKQIAKLLEHIDFCMFTTVGDNGYLVSRPLSTQAAEFDGERLWFFTSARSPKVREIARNKKVNVAYSSTDRNVYASVAGDARLNKDKSKIDQYWKDGYKAYFPGGKDDPDVALIEVMVRTIEYWDGPGSWLGKSIAFIVARVTRNADVMGENKLLRVRKGAPRKKAPAKKAAARKSATKKAATKKAATKKTAAKKTAAKKTAAKRPVKKATKKTARR